MKCAMCGRGMLKAAIFAAGYPVGPTCAKKRGLVPTKTRKAKKEAERDDRTVDMFGGEK